MTYEELADYINDMSPEQQQCDVTVFVVDVGEFYGASDIKVIDEEEDVLDFAHPYITI